jgi:excisionase family DNA binding protein
MDNATKNVVRRLVTTTRDRLECGIPGTSEIVRSPISPPFASNASDTPDEPKPLAVPVKAGCRIIGVGNTTMYGLIKAGRVKTVRIGRRRLIVFASLEALIASDVGAAP